MVHFHTLCNTVYIQTRPPKWQRHEWEIYCIINNFHLHLRGLYRVHKNRYCHRSAVSYIDQRWSNCRSALFRPSLEASHIFNVHRWVWFYAQETTPTYTLKIRLALRLVPAICQSAVLSTWSISDVPAIDQLSRTSIGGLVHQSALCQLLISCLVHLDQHCVNCRSAVFSLYSQLGPGKCRQNVAN